MGKLIQHVYVLYLRADVALLRLGRWLTLQPVPATLDMWTHWQYIAKIEACMCMHDDSHNLTYMMLRVNRMLRFFFGNVCTSSKVVVAAATSRASSTASTSARSAPYPYQPPSLHASPLHYDAPRELQCCNHCQGTLCKSGAPMIRVHHAP
jgi:hypothetical protein